MSAPDVLANQHGTRSCYVNRGCRCDECREANRSECADAKSRRVSRPVPSHIPHGVWSTYTNYNCRCDVCRAEASRFNAAERDRRRRQHPDT